MHFILLCASMETETFVCYNYKRGEDDYENKRKYYRFAEKGQQIQRVNRFFVTEYLIFYAFILFMLWASRAKGVRSLGFAAFVSVIAVVSGGALLIGWKRRPESERLRYLALIGLYPYHFS